jgi:hypothetical protein
VFGTHIHSADADGLWCVTWQPGVGCLLFARLPVPASGPELSDVIYDELFRGGA